MGSPVVAVPARNLLQHELSMGYSFLQGTSTCSSVASSMGCRRTNCVIMIFSVVCKGIFATAPGAPLPPPWSLQGCLSPLTVAVEQFLPFLKYVPTEYLRTLLVSSAVVSMGLFWSWLELAQFNMGAAPGVVSQKSPLYPPKLWQTQYTLVRNVSTNSVFLG